MSKRHFLVDENRYHHSDDSTQRGGLFTGNTRIAADQRRRFGRVAQAIIRRYNTRRRFLCFATSGTRAAATSTRSRLREVRVLSGTVASRGLTWSWCSTLTVTRREILNRTYRFHARNEPADKITDDVIRAFIVAPLSPVLPISRICFPWRFWIEPFGKMKKKIQYI